MLTRYLWIMMLALLAGSCSRNNDDNEPEPDPPPAEITASVLTENLNFPWEIVWGPDDHIWMTEREGRISRVNPANGGVTPLITIGEVSARGEGGLLGMALHPDFAANPIVFVAYNYEKSGTYTEKVVSYRYDGTTLTDPAIIIDDIAAGNIHNGCRLLISADNKLLITTGDAGDQGTAQDPSSVNGKLLRLNLDGSIPGDNPDPSSPVWSLGHRNAQGLTFVGDALYSSEHGPDTDDEINIIQKGGNYGWPDVRGNCEGGEQSFCDANNVIEPIRAWTPTIAVCGMEYYNSDYIPQWKNSLLLCTLKASRLVQLKLDDAQPATIGSSTDYFVDQYGRLRDVCISPEGKVYVCTSNGDNDKIVEISL